MGFNVHIEFESSYNLICNLRCRKKNNGQDGGDREEEYI